MTHTLGGFCPHEVALARMWARDLATRSYFEPLGGDAMRFQLQFYLSALMIAHESSSFLLF